ncbi:CoA pyrophosphatase [Litoreibacter roseus]|uniref:Coenzyme A pyrophosphatase n=1 Tax=Litoreibacter roseus TaxID=2601869 RepID=A0A6N6JH65_9RHOB|nr:CoA pyrophosphatase [Litoreibacter roseus]GFE64729.1 coenzyme A pyrophosphatase [Litoreibacter roseus]
MSKASKHIADIEAALKSHGTASSDFDLNPGISLPHGRFLREAAVLIPLIAVQESIHVILTKRSSALKHHPGQIAFPGGKKDPQDADLIACALRESHEEIGLPHTQVNVLGALPSHETVTGFDVTPIVGIIEPGFRPRPEENEVAEVFSVPLTHLINTDHFLVEGRHWRGSQRHFYTVPYGPYYIWGATARILRALAERLT